jgi:2-isopropylmalate synthase/UPF0716 protein FxsA
MLNRGDISQEEFARMNSSSVIGALLLIIPGFMTDIVGILLQFDYFATLLFRKFIRKNDKTNRQKGDNDVIDVEIIDDRSNR